ncbi:hypothetical protein E2P63_00130, partial [Candidatus Bathyarchaeota archaeon]
MSSKKAVKYAVYTSAVVVFFVFILLPPIFGIVIKWDTIQQVFDQPQLMSRALTAIGNSFVIALAVAALDLVAGIPMAWIMTRSKSRWM